MGQSSMKTYDKIVRQRTKAVVLLLAALVSTVPTHAWRWNIDYWTIAQVGENTAAESGAEGIHNNTLTEQRKKQERIAEYTTLIGENTLYIVTNIPVAVSWLTRKPHINLPLCLNEISNLTMKTEQCIAGFVNIVNNGHVKSPLKDNSLIPGGGGRASIGKDDGYNFMSRSDRMGMANDILEDLVIVRNNLDYLIFMCQTNNGLEDLLMELDPDTWCNAMQMKWTVGDIVSGWEDFG